MYQMTKGPAKMSELVNSLYRPYQPGYRTGLTVQLWGGWSWISAGSEYKTDGEGCGLWHRTTGEWQQVSGTSQFRLSQDRQAALRQLRRHGLTPDKEKN